MILIIIVNNCTRLCYKGREKGYLVNVTQNGYFTENNNLA